MIAQKNISEGLYAMRDTCKWMGIEMLERLRFLASLPLAGTAQTERRETTIR